LKSSDGPNGVRGEAIHASTKSTCFPCGTCMGATFNKDLLQRIGIALGKEAKLKNAGVLLGPTFNIHRHPYGISSPLACFVGKFTLTRRTHL
jgi:beta-glucosidase